MENYHLPTDLEVIVLIAIGYSGQKETLPLNWQERQQAPRQRKTISEFASNTEWLS